MTEQDREFLKEFIHVLKGERDSQEKRAVWIPAVMDLIKVGAVIWGAAMIVGEVQVLRRDVNAQSTAIAEVQSTLARHRSASARIHEHFDGRVATLEEKVGIKARDLPEDE